MMFRNTGVVVIDDMYDEVKPLLKVLNKKGIGLTCYKGTDYREFPPQPLIGVRLLFLDLVLGTDGQSDRNKISTVIGVVKKVISPDNGPYIIFAWTKHDIPQDDLLALFKKEILRDEKFPKPVVVINLEKRDCMNNLNKINKKIKEKFSNKNILEILLQWENHAHNALCDVLRMLSDISKPPIAQSQSFDDYSSRWNSELEKHIFKISETLLGKNIKSDRNLIIAAQLALTNPFHDYIETGIKKNTKPFRQLTQQIISHKSDSYNDRERAVMNTSFLLVTHDVDTTIQPGNIYRFNDVFEKIKCKRKECYYHKAKLTKQKIADEFFSGSIKTYRRKQALLKKVIPVILEVTPECDYVYAKWKTAKLVLGILWPESFGSILSANSRENKPDYVYKPLPIIYQNEVYYLTFNAHHIFNINFHVFKTVSPILKARKELLVDIQHWFSGHISRPGKTEF